jgi:hypothetical protein
MPVRNDVQPSLLPQSEPPLLTHEAFFDWEQREFAYSVEAFGLLPQTDSCVPATLEQVDETYEGSPVVD